MIRPVLFVTCNLCNLCNLFACSRSIHVSKAGSQSAAYTYFDVMFFKMMMVFNLMFLMCSCYVLCIYLVVTCIPDVQFWVIITMYKLNPSRS